MSYTTNKFKATPPIVQHALQTIRKFTSSFLPENAIPARKNSQAFVLQFHPYIGQSDHKYIFTKHISFHISIILSILHRSISKLKYNSMNLLW